MPLRHGTRLGVFEILAPLGAGGMGEVYRARDTRLGRDVAIKMLLDPAVTDRARLARFEREARAVAALNHPNIVVLHTIEEHDGVPFLAMEYVEGETLAAWAKAGDLTIERILEMAIPLADALVAAHGKGVVHRDLKPGNVMVTPEGRVKVLDFGLAKLSHDGQADGDGDEDETVTAPLTELGTTVGTVPYMAPEQLVGGTVDARADLFAFGVILFELAAGRRPFTGANAVAISAAILHEEAPSLATLRPDLPAGFERIVARCLQKEPADRYPDARALQDDLKALRQAPVEPTAVTAATPAAVSIAVLPFANRTANAEDEYFSDGLADELLNVLVKIPRLHVAARASSFHFKGKDAPLAEVGQALNVSTVLDGSVRKAGDRVRISVQLVNVADGYHLWSETYDRTLDDIFAVQDDIAHSVVTELRGRLLGEGDDAPTSSEARAHLTAVGRERSYDPQAYDLYLRGRYMFGASVDGPVRAQELFREAIERSPRFALAYTGLGESLVTQSWLGSREREMTVAQAKGALAKALELDDQLCEARLLAGQIKLYFDWDWAGAEREFRAALEVAPGSDLAHLECGSFLSLMGRWDEGLAAVRRAQALDPLSVNSSHEVGYQLLAIGRFEEATVEFRKAIDLNPTWVWGNIKLGMTWSYLGEHEKAMACVKRADELIGDTAATPLSQAWRAVIELNAGNPERARTLVARFEEQARSEYVDPVPTAWLHYALGDHEATLAGFERGYELRSPMMAFLVQGRPVMWRDVADDPRYEALVRKMAFPV